MKGSSERRLTSSSTARHSSWDRSAPVGLWQEACSSTTARGGRRSSVAIIAPNCTPPVCGSKYG